MTNKDGYFVCEKDEKRFYINKENEVFTKELVQYILSRNFHSILPYKSIDGKMGYLDYKGNVFIEAKHTKTYPFYEGKAWVQKQ
ncbi:MAG: WG repeat-containing protein [Flavobacterium sp.]|uniref:WG repeat-containing protein n=1 Tax=Flavobacterium sp. TaxID=239 RepID=UPI0026208095|nr:WG repeat-containing protein [Flavobacterium sp.]MDD5149313.1 WG repeat-containing protein [Flavobacterium sp.]